MRSTAEQVAGLLDVAELLLARRTPSAICFGVGDVPVLTTFRRREVAYASDEYDVWERDLNGQMTLSKPDVGAGLAARLLMASPA
ncbi:MAG: hypothetical protein M3499_04305 [Actinomycetota bacterium]|nr:hypothetical protein [Actinomycetota bacterium]